MAEGNCFNGGTTWNMINDIMDKFQFENVHKAMQAVNWCWHGGGVPELHEIKNAARRLLKEAAFSPTGYCASGGFRAERKESGDMYLLFYIDCCDANGADLIEEEKV